MPVCVSVSRVVLCSAALLAVASCGGGGDDPPANSAPPPGSSPPPQVTATCGHADFVNQVLLRVNQRRAQGASCGAQGSFGPAPALAWNNLLTQAAAAHSQDMATNNFFSHTGSNGSTMAQRVTATGYDWSSLAENIAAGQTSIQQVVDGWMASPGHCANIMNANYQQVGVACVPGTAGSTYSSYWTMNLARPR